MQDSAVLSWAANNTAKLQLQHPGHPNLSCWTLFSTNAYGQANKVPQEAVPDDVAAKVTSDMLTALATALNRSQPLPPPVFTRCQLWGAALPVNSPKVGCISDPLARVGVCGDFCSGSGVESAVLSGLDLAQRIGGLRGLGLGPEAEALACGLHEQFVALQESGIGEIAGAPAEQQQQGQQRQQQQGQQRQQRRGRTGSRQGEANGSRAVQHADNSQGDGSFSSSGRGSRAMGSDGRGTAIAAGSAVGSTMVQRPQHPGSVAVR